MKAIRIHSFGGSDVLTVDDVPKPRPADREILIKVLAASVNPVDYKIRSGEFSRAELKPPLTLGRDVSGVVEAVGAQMSAVRVGEEVYAMLGMEHGGYAEYAIANWQQFAGKPKSVDHVHAAAVPLAATTAWQGLFDHGQLRPRERVLIHGAAGGVGHFAVQFAKARSDAHVIVTGRAEDESLLRELGADEFIDYKAQRFDDDVRDIDVVLDLVAGETQTRSWKVLRRGGRLVSTLGQPSAEEVKRHDVMAIGFMAQPRHEQLVEFARLIDTGEVSVFVERTEPLEQARRAHDHMEHDHIQGKVVLTV